MMDKHVKKLIRETNAAADKVTFKRDGTIVFRRGYFYAHGYNAEKFAKRVKADLAEHGIKAEIVGFRNHWAPWPRETYWEVTMRV